ncbi:MAG: DUF1565 domain-containing protein [Pseudomonadota bacterium]
MVKSVTSAHRTRVTAIAFGGLSLLLSGCGGAAPDQQEFTDLKTAGFVSSSAAVVAAAPVQAGPASDADYALAGYAGNPLAERNGDDAMQAGIAPSAGALATVPATTYNYYVSPKGNDSNPGTAAAPFRTLARAASAVKASTTVFVAPGTYEGGFKTSASGTASARIYFVSTTKWGARIVMPKKSVNNTAWDNRGSYVDIIGFHVDGTYDKSGTRWTLGIYNGGSHDSIRHNWVHHIATGAPCTSAGGSAIGVDSYYGGVKSEVIGNLVNDIGPAGCRFVQGIYISTSGSVKNNVVYRVAEGGIHLWHDANNVIITNNTVTASNTGIIVGGGDYYKTSGPNNHTAVYSNIVYDNKMGISEQGQTGKNNTYRNNLVFKNSTYNWKLNNGLSHTGTVSSEPYFVAYKRVGTPNLRLSGSSPAIGRGTDVHAHAKDFAERPRNHGTGFDIGAYQH